MRSRRPAIGVALLVSALALGVPAESTPGMAAQSGGTLRVVNPTGPPTLDPALTPLGVGWNALWYGVCATLTAFRDAPAPAGFQVEPEAAAGPPQVSRDGRTYTFTIRRGLRFSDGERMTAGNFAHALGRVRNPIMRSEGASLYSDVRRISASGRRLRIELRKPSGDLLTRLALAYACPVPLGFPVDPAGVRLMVGSGPYYVARYEADRLLVLGRNRHYRGSRPHRIDRLVLTIGGDLEENIRAVADGRAEVGPEIPIELRLDLARRYGVNKEQFFRIGGTSVTALVLNTSSPLFRGNAALRKAVNLALDRGAILRSRDGWSVARQASDQIITRWIPGWVDHRLYPLTGPNLHLASRLAAGNLRGGKAVLWVPASPGSLDQAKTIVRNLSEIGLEVEVKALSNEVLMASAGTPGATYDMALETNVALDYPDPANVIIRLLAGENARKPTDNSNHAYFDVPAYNRRMAAADRLVGSARLRAFARLDADIMRNEAPWAPLYEGSSSLFVSTHVGCLKVHPVFRIDYAAMCLR